MARTLKIASALLLLGAAVAATSRSPRLEAVLIGEARAEGQGDDLVVARVGDVTITKGELERRMAQTPRNELASFGSSAEQIRRNFLDHVLIRDIVMANEARERGLDKLRDIRERTLGAYRALLLSTVRSESKADAISDEEVKAYYDANPDRFVSPKRLSLFRILVDSEAEAASLIAELGERPELRTWNTLVKNKSVDPESKKRGGNLGQVAEDGSTGMAETRVDPALYAAADPVKEGTVVPTPVREGKKWAVVWKRGTNPPVAKSLDAETPAIRAAMADERMRSAMQDLLERLRKEDVRELNPELCDAVSVNASTTEVERTKRPGSLPRSKRAANPAPTEGPGGLR